MAVQNSPFRLTSLTYAEKFGFENPVIMEEKQCKQTERFSVMAKGNNYFLSLDDKSKQRYKVKINNIQGYDPYQIKKGKNIQAILVSFHWCSDIAYYS